MMNYRVSFTTCYFDKSALQEWMMWVNDNQFPISDSTIEEVQNASDAKDNDSPT